MKTLLLVLFTLSSVILHAQQTVFVRIYNKQQQKISKGFLKSVTDSSMTVGRGFNSYTAHLDDIGKVRTKRSAGANIGIGALVGGSLCALGAGLSTDPDAFIFNDPGVNAFIGLFLGATAGTAIGAVTLSMKQNEKFMINGEALKLKEFSDWAKQHQYIK